LTDNSVTSAYGHGLIFGRQKFVRRVPLVSWILDSWSISP